MTTFTKSDLATRILRDASLIGADEVPSAVDLLFAEETLSCEIDLLAGKGVNIWNGSELEIPSEYFTTLSRRVGITMGPAFGLSTAAEATVALTAMEKDLRMISAVPGTGAVMKVQNF